MQNFSGHGIRRKAGMASTLSRRRVVASTSAQDGIMSDASQRSSTPVNAPPDKHPDVYAPNLTLMDSVVLLGIKDKEGYLSFWNDSISYVLRGLIIIELALRGRVKIIRDSIPGRYERDLRERYLGVCDDRSTGEALLDETLKMIRANTSVDEKMSVSTWVNVLSGETWSLSKIGFQLKQVRERLAKGLVEKGVLRTEKRNFLLFDMATHPVQDSLAKRKQVDRVVSVLLRRAKTIVSNATNGNTSVEDEAPDAALRDQILVCAAFAAAVLDNALAHLDFDERERAFERADSLMSELKKWPNETLEWKTVIEETTVSRENLEVVAAVISIFSKMDSVL